MTVGDEIELLETRKEEILHDLRYAYISKSQELELERELREINRQLDQFD